MQAHLHDNFLNCKILAMSRIFDTANPYARNVLGRYNFTSLSVARYIMIDFELHPITLPGDLVV